jgi:hypothetical protein
VFLVKKKCFENKFLDQKITSSDFLAIIWGGTSNALLIYFFVKKIVFHLLKKKLVNLGTRAWAIMHTGLGFFLNPIELDHQGQAHELQSFFSIFLKEN